jgi:hypothetical protein
MEQFRNHKAHIPRPPNSWILYRTDTLRTLSISPSSRRKQSSISQEISEMWKSAPPELRAEYQEKAERAKEEHKRKYPDYAYRPRSKKTKEREREERKERRKERISGSVVHGNAAIQYEGVMGGVVGYIPLPPPPAFYNYVGHPNGPQPLHHPFDPTSAPTAYYSSPYYLQSVFPVMPPQPALAPPPPSNADSRKPHVLPSGGSSPQTEEDGDRLGSDFPIAEDSDDNWELYMQAPGA